MRQITKGCSPDLIALGFVKRKLTSLEASQVTADVMRDFGNCSPDVRVTMAILKAIDITWKHPLKDVNEGGV